MLLSGFPALACSMGHEIKKDSLLAVSIFLIVWCFGIMSLQIVLQELKKE